jgi:Ran GTPase-activating protein (RanGAP) involved in mRNA processing and transport
MATSEMHYYDNTARNWLLKTSRLLMDNEWPCDRPLLLDGSSFRIDYRDEANTVFFDSLLRNKTARVLTLKNVQFSLNAGSYLEKLLLKNKNLRILNFCNVSIENKNCFLPESLSGNTTIQELGIDNCKLSPGRCADLGKLMRTSQSLKLLNLSNLNLGNAATEIAKALESNCGSLCHLEMSDNRMDSESLSSLLKSLQRNKTLVSLRLNKSGIGPKHASDLADLLATNKHLKALSLCDNSLNGASIRIMAEQGLGHNDTLQMLFLSHNPIGDEGAIHLTDFLMENTVLQSLVLVDCEIWRRGCRYLAQGLAKMRGLRQLTVDGVELEDQVEHVLESVKTNMSLVNLLTDRMHILLQSNDQWKEVAFYLRLNRAKRRFLIEKHMPLSLLPRVLEESTRDPDALFYLILHMPQLVKP